ncbi:UNVERIFIED_CONTAM: hypothetical protein Sradi_6192800 [Sesamum radiatum]|uniref:Reverse transcriptase domain-containing protein n=1 Tax=Sesamum radiatum TaxID=300843 RepID=A0AAW2KAK8_SESRA
MPFGLKNAGATYQRLVNNMFREQIGKNMEVYIDDMLVKSKRKRTTLKIYKPALTYCKGVLDVPPLADEAERRRTSVPVPRNITRSSKRRSHASRSAKSSTVYYVSKTLQGAEERYPPIEKLAFPSGRGKKVKTLLPVTSSSSLTNYPLKQVLAEPNISGRMVKWAVELSEHGIEYRPRPAIKAQALADFMVELIDEGKETSQCCGSYSWMGRPPRKGAGQV